ncbi:hypothetical protein NLU13_7053 [Sarocladium strictum]|uniref:Uncharacterized protein n=1 Tax=Sarocladium strictum TaxID=5046 RepID=A0AA39L628_SARSR|nr:hypothetical protein NLU13_7053 [Sarocladium strictum]
MAHVKAKVIDLTLDEDDGPPRKKQRTEQTPTTPVPTTIRSVPSSSYKRPPNDVLEQKIFPQIQAAMRELPHGVYNKALLGVEVFKRLTQDEGFLASGRATGWKFSPERENMLAAKIAAITAEIKYRFFLPAPKVATVSPQNNMSRPVDSAPRIPMSPQGMAHRPVGTTARHSTASPTSNSPVPLPAYAHAHRQDSQRPQISHNDSPPVKETVVPLPPSILPKMTQSSSTTSHSSGTGNQQQGSVVKGEVPSPPVEPRTEVPHVSKMPKITDIPLTPRYMPREQMVARATAVQPPRPRRSSGLSITSAMPKVWKVPARQPRTTEIVQHSLSLSEAVNFPSFKPTAKAFRKDTPNEAAADDKRKPYLSARQRREIAECVRNTRSATPGQLASSQTFHVDLTDEELEIVESSLRSIGANQLSLNMIKHLPKRTDLDAFLSQKLEGRSVSDMHNFLEGLPEYDEGRPKYQISLARDDFLEQQRRRDRRLNALRLDREMNGSFGIGSAMTQRSLQTEAQRDLSDSIGHTFARFGQCSGDVATMVWVSERTLVCGATSTMDDRTLDHNKQGNLVLYSASRDKLEVFKDHREPRPVKEGEHGDFSRAKWLYPSVVASTIDPERKLVYTAAFDKTVKVWDTSDTMASSSMKVVGTWPHGGKVNFVAAALDGSGLVATAADVSSEAVRVYATNMHDPSSSQYVALSCPRRDDHGTDEWAYWPSTLQWGTAEGTRHLLAVGYSPRSRDGDESQIPEDKLRTGAILLWDSRARRVIPVHANTVANVFEVMWHPTLPQLIVATSRSGLNVRKGVRTQIRIWKQDPDRIATDQGWHEYKTLDCTAEDINELTVMPNSSHHSYVTASCTSGEIFVWDTARGDQPIHILRHGPSIEPFENEEDMKRRDVGVKFTAWGQTPDRLFTGSSDGKVNLWNVRKTKPFIRTVMQGEGAIFCGSFSPDRKLLAIGDGPGNVWVLTDPDEYPESWGKVCKKRHIPYVPDEDVDAMQVDDPEDDYPRRRYLDTQQLVHTRNPVIGVVQGPAYDQSNHFDLKAHLNEDKDAPLIPSVERQQQAAKRATQPRRRSVRRLKFTAEHSDPTVEPHTQNSKHDLDLSQLEPGDYEALTREGVEFEMPYEGLAYESE